jgi:hypothetical protein
MTTLTSFTRPNQVWQHKRSATPVLVIRPADEDGEVGILNKSDHEAIISERALHQDYDLVGNATNLNWWRLCGQPVPTLSDRAHKVLEAIAHLTVTAGFSGPGPMPSVQDVADYCDLTDKTVQRTLDGLCSKGLVRAWTIDTEYASYVATVRGLRVIGA